MKEYTDKHGYVHADDSYGQCVRCRIWQTDDADGEPIYLTEPWPCPTVRNAALTEALVDIEQVTKGEPRMDGSTTFPGGRSGSHLVGRVHNRARVALGDEPLRIADSQRIDA